MQENTEIEKKKKEGNKIYAKVKRERKSVTGLSCPVGEITTDKFYWPGKSDLRILNSGDFRKEKTTELSFINSVPSSISCSQEINPRYISLIVVKLPSKQETYCLFY